MKPAALRAAKSALRRSNSASVQRASRNGCFLRSTQGLCTSPCQPQAGVGGRVHQHFGGSLEPQRLLGAHLIPDAAGCSRDIPVVQGAAGRGLVSGLAGEQAQPLVDAADQRADPRHRMTDGIDQPLPEGGPEANWPLLSASPQQYLDGVSQWSRAMTREDMDRVRDDFVRSTRLVRWSLV